MVLLKDITTYNVFKVDFDYELDYVVKFAPKAKLQSPSYIMKIAHKNFM
jgi:hypothetical protein